MNDASGVQQTFRLEEATIDDLHRAIQAGETTVVDVVKRYIERVRAFNGVASMLVTEDGAAVAEAKGTVRAGAPLQVPDADGEGVHHPARSRQIQRPADRIRADGADCLRSERAAAVRHDRRHSQRRAGQRHRHAQHPRRALGHLQGRVRQASIARGRCRPARRRSANTSASSPTHWSAPPSSTRNTAATPISKKCRCTAWCSRSRTRSTPRTCARPAAATPATTWTFPARDHVLVEQLRNKGAIIFAKAVNTEYNGRAGDPGGRNQAGQGAALDARLSAQHLGGQSVEPLRHHALGLARLELRLGAVGQRQHGDGEPR